MTHDRPCSSLWTPLDLGILPNWRVLQRVSSILLAGRIYHTCLEDSVNGTSPANPIPQEQGLSKVCKVCSVLTYAISGTTEHYNLTRNIGLCHPCRPVMPELSPESSSALDGTLSAKLDLVDPQGLKLL